MTCKQAEAEREAEREKRNKKRYANCPMTGLNCRLSHDQIHEEPGEGARLCISTTLWPTELVGLGGCGGWGVIGGGRGGEGFAWGGGGRAWVGGLVGLDVDGRGGMELEASQMEDVSLRSVPVGH